MSISNTTSNFWSDPQLELQKSGFHVKISDFTIFIWVIFTNLVMELEWNGNTKWFRRTKEEEEKEKGKTKKNWNRKKINLKGYQICLNIIKRKLTKNIQHWLPWAKTPIISYLRDQSITTNNIPWVTVGTKISYFVVIQNPSLFKYENLLCKAVRSANQGSRIDSRLLEIQQHVSFVVFVVVCIHGWNFLLSRK